jgi:cytochrome c oxidase subunit II
VNEFMSKILYLPPQASSVAQGIDQLHYFVITVTMLGAFGVALACFIFIYRYRRSAHRGGYLAPREDSSHTHGGLPFWLEGVVIAGLLGLFTLWWVIGYVQYVHLRSEPEDPIEIYVVGKKWMWSYAYPDGGGSNAVLYVPADRPVKLLLTSRDVIHSFFVPAFRVKQDAVPGRVTSMWFEAIEPGTYPIYCTEYCGAGHSTMLGEVVVLSDADYAARMESLPRIEIAGTEYGEPAALGDVPRQALTLAEMGERVAAVQGCLRCHTVDGAPHIGPTFAGLYLSEVPLASGEVVVADAAYLTSSMMDPLAMIRAGYPPVMPSYLGILSAAETGALVEYIRSLRDVPPATRMSPLVPEGAGPIQLPSSAAEPRAREGKR